MLNLAFKSFARELMLPIIVMISELNSLFFDVRFSCYSRPDLLMSCSSCWSMRMDSRSKVRLSGEFKLRDSPAGIMASSKFLPSAYDESWPSVLMRSEEDEDEAPPLSPFLISISSYGSKPSSFFSSSSSSSTFLPVFASITTMPLIPSRVTWVGESVSGISATRGGPPSITLLLLACFRNCDNFDAF